MELYRISKLTAAHGLIYIQNGRHTGGRTALKFERRTLPVESTNAAVTRVFLPPAARHSSRLPLDIVGNLLLLRRGAEPRPYKIISSTNAKLKSFPFDEEVLTVARRIRRFSLQRVCP